MIKIAFAGGGTAGHVMPNLAIIDALKKRADVQCVYIGGDGMEKELCKKRGLEFYRIDTVKLRRDAVFKNAAVPFKLRACVKTARRVLDEVRPDLIFSKGGYAALPVVLAAKDIPLLAHESDLTAGIVTKLSKRRAKMVLCSFEPLAQKFKNGEYVGAPLRSELFGAAKARLGFGGNKPVLLVTGGSSGAAALNTAVVAALPVLTDTFDVVHITGKNKKGAPDSDCYKSMEFCDDMPGLYAACDIALTRGGANALAELIALEIPSVVVPLEKASRGDQIQNAEYYKARGAVDVLREENLRSDVLVQKLKAAYRNRAEYVSSMKKLKVNGTNRIVDIILDTVKASQAD